MSEKQATVNTFFGFSETPAPNSEASKALEEVIKQIGDKLISKAEKSPGSIIEQVPAKGAEIEVGSCVNLTVAVDDFETATVPVPDVLGMSHTEATDLLKDSGLHHRRLEVKVSTDKSSGTVIAQDPAAGIEIKRGSGVDLTVADDGVEPSTTTVPVLTGMQQAEAMDVLQGTGLYLGDLEEFKFPDTSAIRALVDASAGRITGLIAGFLDERFLNILQRVWEEGGLAQKYLDEENYDPDESITLKLIEHQVSRAFNHKIDVLLNEVKVLTVDLGLKLTLDLEGIILNIQGGKILSIEAGQLTGGLELTCWNVPVYNFATKPTDLPGILNLTEQDTDEQ